MTFEQVHGKDGTYSSTLLRSVDHLPLEEQLAYETGWSQDERLCCRKSS